MAYFGDSTDGHECYWYFDFLAVDLHDDRVHYNWKFTDDGHLRTSGSNGGEVFASVHTNTNSLVHTYTASRISGPWSYLHCEVAEDGTLTCESGEKALFYICETGSALVRHTAVLDGYTALRIEAEELPDR